MKKLIALVLCSVTCAFLFAQQPSVNWTTSMEPMKRFIENKSQFDVKKEIAGSQILFAVDHGSTQIYFTKNGLTFYLEKKHGEEPEHERIKEEKLREMGYNSKRDEEEEVDKSDWVRFEWQGANPAVNVIGIDEARDYFSYTVGEGAARQNINYIKGYQRLVYQNLYSGVDVEYTFHPIGGIKYKIILHPGADITQVKMRYADRESVLLDEIGNVKLATVFGNIVDNAPITFYEEDEKTIIPSHFVASNKTISFALDNFNNRKTVIIDPWTITPALPSDYKVFNIKTDTSGNAYIFGGDSPDRVQKYDSTGALQWTYNTPWNIATWGFGGLAVDPPGNSYVTSGDGQISKINTNGGLVWIGGNNSGEYWSPVFNCDYSQLLVGGTNVVNPLAFQFLGAAFEIDLNTGSTLGIVNVANILVGAPNTPPFIPNEIRSMCYSPNGNYYFLTLDTVGSLSPSLAINYRDSSFYNLSYYTPYGKGDGQGMNSICATENLLYTTNGRLLHKRDIHNGRILSTVTIPNGSTELTSGIAVDSCGNVYVGSVTKVHMYDMNLNLLATANAPAEVYDVAISASGEVLACGNGFAMSVDMGSCAPLRPVCVTPLAASVSNTNGLCNGVCGGTAKATPTNGNPPYTYLWSNGQITDTASNLCAGVHSVTVIDAANQVYIGSVDVEQPTLIITGIIPNSTGCVTGAVVTAEGGIPPYTYQWSNGDTLAGITNVPSGMYAVVVTDSNNCSVTDSMNIPEAPGLALTPSIVNTVCACDGIATVTVLGGHASYDYQWSNGNTQQTSSNLCADSYTVTVTESRDANAVFWSEDFTNGGAGWTLNLPGPGTNSTNANSWVINNNLSACTQCPVTGSGGNYLHITCTSFPACVSDAGSCIYDQGIPIFSNAATDRYVTSPGISTLATTNITLSFGYMSDGEATDYGLVRLSDDGGVSWTDLPTKYFGTFSCMQAVVPIPAHYENISNFRIGFRWINDNNQNGSDPPFMIDDIELRGTNTAPPCSNTAVVDVNGPSPISMTASITKVLCEGGNEGAIKLTPLGGTSPYTVAWAHGDSVFSLTDLAPGIYTATVTDANGCTKDSSIDVSATSTYQVEAVPTNSSCGGGADGSVLANITSNTTPPYSYAWSTGSTDAGITNVAPGAYSVTVTDALGCLRIDTAIVNEGAILIEDSVKNTSCPTSADGSVTVTASGGTAPYTYTWNNGASSAQLQNVKAGTYTVSVNDQNDCSGSKTVEVMVDTASTIECNQLEIYDVFSPNGDGVNDSWIIDGVENYGTSELQVFNRWGNKVFEASPYVNNWTGISDKGEALPSAVYYYILKLNDVNKSIYSGPITIIR